MFYQDLFSPLGIGAGSEEKPIQVVCYIVGNETWEVERKEKIGNEDMKFAFLL